MKEYTRRMIQRGRRSFIIDLADCELMDSTFMGTMAGIALRLRELGSGGLTVLNANTRNQSLLENLGLDHLFGFQLPEGETMAPKQVARETLPPTTGETANGKSMSDTNSVRPGKRNRAMAHAAATPNNTLAMTADGATMSVSMIAWRVSASAVRLFQYVAQPGLSAW